jgi:hypothetical protein
VEVLLEQLHRALQHRQRRPQLVRRGRHEGPPRGFLAPQLLLHARERAREVAHLVLAGVLRHRHRRALRRDPQGGRAQAAQPPQQRVGERDRERDRDEQTDAGGRHERAADLLDGVGDLGQPPPGDHDADHAALAVQRDAHGDVVAAHDEHGLLAVQRPHGGEEGLARRRAALGVGEEARGRLLGVGRRQREVGDEHPPRGLVGELEHPVAERDLAVHRAAAAERVLEARPRGEHGRAQALDALVAQALLERAEDDCGGGAERDHAREHERQQEAAAQPAEGQAQARPHASRKR